MPQQRCTLTENAKPTPQNHYHMGQRNKTLAERVRAKFCFAQLTNMPFREQWVSPEIGES
eukprot:4922924-Amphidinium_carterae.1